MRAILTAFAAMILLCGCQPKTQWHAEDVTGTLPDLSLVMTRASDGAAVTAKALQGKLVLLYFGYTHCPDVCPTTLADLGDALQKMGPQAQKVQVLFVSVDPDRDSLDLLKAYARSFGPQFDALRGPDKEIAALARRYRQAYSVRKTPDYVVMHTSAVTVFDGHGKARLVAAETRDTAGLAQDLIKLASGG